MRNWKSYPLNDHSVFRQHLLNYSRIHQHFIFLDGCENEVYGRNKFRYLLAAGNNRHIELNSGNAFEQLKQFVDEQKDWCFGYFGYDLKNELEKLNSAHPDHIGFSDLVFFIPEILIIVDEEIRVGSLSGDHDELITQIRNHENHSNENFKQSIQLKQRIAKKEYLEKINLIRQHIIEGDIYEMNLCQEFFAEDVTLDAQLLFQNLCSISKAPFSVLFRWGDKYLISSSPERFLNKERNKISSQPIKGTIKRSENANEDDFLKSQLAVSIKDRAENVMIVDLVRNDLAKSCKPGTIKVEELFGIYSFEQVHHMISTISGELKGNIHPVDVIKNAFPMGSMTGAPKVMAMELIDQYEASKRGLYSGSIGYFTPEMDFDFNVVIRSLLYNAQQKYLSAHVGGAVVFDSVPEEEYEECVVKLSALEQALIAGGTN